MLGSMLGGFFKRERPASHAEKTPFQNKLDELAAIEKDLTDLVASKPATDRSVEEIREWNELRVAPLIARIEAFKKAWPGFQDPSAYFSSVFTDRIKKVLAKAKSAAE